MDAEEGTTNDGQNHSIHVERPPHHSDDLQKRTVDEMSTVKRRVEGFMAQVEASRESTLRAYRTKPPDDLYTEPAGLNTDHMLLRAAHQRANEAFVPLFGPTEDADEHAAVARVIASDALQSTSLCGGASMSGQSLQPTTVVRHEGTAKLSVQGPPAPPQTASFGNARPMSAAALHTYNRLGSAGSQSKTTTATNSKVSRLVSAFFRSLPPVIPSRPGSSHPTRVYLPSASSPEGTGPEAIATAAGRKEFYYLNIRVVNLQHVEGAAMSDWIFSVTITDVTHPARQPTQTFSQLRLNSDSYLVFRPPSRTTFSPVDDLTWMTTPQQLFQHTLRIQVVATFPRQTKVVDTQVHFGVNPS